jgi:hypothetical protein
VISMKALPPPSPAPPPPPPLFFKPALVFSAVGDSRLSLPRVPAVLRGISFWYELPSRLALRARWVTLRDRWVTLRVQHPAAPDTAETLLASPTAASTWASTSVVLQLGCGISSPQISISLS